MLPKTRRIILCFPALLQLFAVALYADEHRPDCLVCGMWIDHHRRTRHVFTIQDGGQVMFCSLTCAAKYLRSNAADIKHLQVADYLSTELIDTANAIYLVGSDAPPVMSNTSIIAFASREDAERFQQQHGGRLMQFDQVLSLE